MQTGPDLSLAPRPYPSRPGVRRESRQPRSRLSLGGRPTMLRAALALLLLGAGCAHHPTFPSDRVASLPGVYGNGDGFWPRSLVLQKGGEFTYTQLTDLLKGAPDGSLTVDGGWQLSGRWRCVPPDKIEMSTDPMPRALHVFVRRSREHEVAILEPDLFPDILRRWKDDGSWGYLKKIKSAKPDAKEMRNAPPPSPKLEP